MKAGLFAEIERQAHDDKADLGELLRKCLALGGETQSAELRAWASSELKGYAPTDVLPAYRSVGKALLLDGARVQQIIRGQQVPAMMLPSEHRDLLAKPVDIRQPISELWDLVKSARAAGDGFISFGVPGGEFLVALINADIARAEREQFPWAEDLPPSQVVERIYQSVSVSSLVGIIDVVRTTLVELVAEMRAGMSPGQDLPSSAVTQDAVQVAVYGKKSRVTVQKLDSGGGGIVASQGGRATADAAEPESTGRRISYWLFGIATVLGLGVALIAWWYA